ncbi:polyadenylate-binding protein-interacting protein 1 isoform X2 [Aplysia californica]|uniref:Polyadenylate-binding protein-interacting protein 1 isoform X2 n=1 Tax=Aplysia californica TaxID=6500 RepID=A0ABM1W3P1_APLCA|nr:polyadenylate-binding protein-interacting protein 1 isoform X2 [Aplysia californica]
MSSNENTGIPYTGAWSKGPPSDIQARRRPGQSSVDRVINTVKTNEAQNQMEPRLTTPPGPENGTRPQREQQLTLPKVPTQLSATAKEFVPQSKVLSYDYNSGLGFDMNSFSALSIGDHSGGQLDQSQGPSGGPILDRFANALYRLNMSPGNMEEYLRPICDLIKNCPKDVTEKIMNDMVESLFEQSIQEPNFRYTGARICQYLSSNLKSNTFFSGFHKVLMRRCQKDYEKREELISGSPEDQTWLRGLAMFMAEIFLNVEIEQENGTVSRLHYLPKVLTDFIHTLLSRPTEQEVKCCCQLLKLSGALIEDGAKHNGSLCELFEGIFTQLAKLQTRGELTPNTKALVGSVIQLKEQNWYRNSSSPPKKPSFPCAPEPPPFQQEPVFFNNCGVPCSRREANLPEEDLLDDEAYVLNEEEEAAFLAWQEEEGLTSERGPWGFNDTGYDSYNLDMSDEGGMGDEVEAAYEEFLQEQNHYSGRSGQNNNSRGGGGGQGHMRSEQQQQPQPQHYIPPHAQQMPHPPPGGAPVWYPSHQLQGGACPPDYTGYPGFAPLPPQQPHHHQQQQQQQHHHQQHHQNQRQPAPQQQHQQQQQQPPHSHGGGFPPRGYY